MPVVDIPRTELGTILVEAATIKRDMTDLLEELEAQAIRQAGRPEQDPSLTKPQKPAKPGTWRQDPAAWAKTYLKP